MSEDGCEFWVFLLWFVWNWGICGGCLSICGVENSVWLILDVSIVRFFYYYNVVVVKYFIVVLV